MCCRQKDGVGGYIGVTPLLRLWAGGKPGAHDPFVSSPPDYMHSVGNVGKYLRGLLQFVKEKATTTAAREAGVCV
jgi:hypothetical protein